MAHEHHHEHSPVLSTVNRALVIGIGLNLLFVIIEVIIGFTSNSLALLSDAGHNLGDVAGLLLALMAFRLSKAKANKNYTYGYGKSTILAALLNAIILLITVGAIGIEALQRLREPEVLQAKSVAIVAAIGIFINAFTAWQFFTNKDKDINIKGAYLHLATDALVSMGVVIAGILIYYTHWYWLDSAVSLIIMIVVFLSTWGLMKESFKLSMDGVPHGVSINEVQKVLMTANITSYHHLHIWAISSSENALTAHIVVPDFKTNHALKKDLKHKLLHENIHHATFEFELQEENCEEWEHSK